MSSAKNGRKRGGKCRKPGRRAHGRRCTRYVRVRGGFSVGGSAGANSFRFTGRLANRKLTKGRYRLVATPDVGGKTGTSARVRFKIK